MEITLLKKYRFAAVAGVLICLNACVVFAQQPIMFIDQFDQANYKTLAKGDWYTFDDQQDSGASRIAMNYSYDAIRNTRVLGFSYTLQKATYKWDPYVSMACSLSVKQMDLDSVQAIAYEFKGARHHFLYRGATVKDYAYFQKAVEGSEGWTTIVIPLADLRQPNWGKKVTFNEQDVHSLGWQISGKSNDSGSVWIDNVRLLKTIDESLLTEEQKKRQVARLEEKKKLDLFVQELLYTVDDSLLRTIGEDGAQLLKYRAAIRKIKSYEIKVDSLLELVKKSSLTPQGKDTFAQLVRLAKNSVSGDVYDRVRASDRDQIPSFNKVIALSFLYNLEKEYVKQLRTAEAIKQWVTEVYEYSSLDEGEAQNVAAPDSVVLKELTLYGFKKNEVVAEVGAGAGYFEQSLSRYCDHLTVYVNEVDSALVAKLRTKLVFLQLQDKKNISYTAVWGNEKSARLPAGQLDKIITKNAFHHFKFPNEMLQDFKKSMKKGGKLFIVETMRDEIEIPWCQELITREQFMGYLTGNGFLLVKETTLRKGNVKCFEFKVGR